MYLLITLIRFIQQDIRWLSKIVKGEKKEVKRKLTEEGEICNICTRAF